MIVTVTLNPALDYLIPLDQVHPGTIHRFSRGTFAPGGKGVNVSLLLTSLGVENRALGLAAGRHWLAAGAAAAGFACLAALRPTRGDKL